MSSRESSIVDQILERARKVSGMLLRKRHGSPFGVAGDPDLYGSWDGVHIEIEVKRPGEKPSPLQLKRLEEWRGAGAIVAVCHSASEFSEFLIVQTNLQKMAIQAALPLVVGRAGKL